MDEGTCDRRPGRAVSDPGTGSDRSIAGDAHVATIHELSIDLAGGACYRAPGERFVAERTTYVVTGA